MKSSEKYFIFIFLVIILSIILYRFKDYIIDRNFDLIVNTKCSEGEKNCFKSDCTPGPDCDETPYKKVQISSNGAPKCLEEHTCENFTCNENYKKCSITYCSNETLSDGEVCVDNIK